MKNALRILFLIWGLSSCQTTGYFVSDSQLQLPEIRKAVHAVMGKPRQVSVNGRELISEYHSAQFTPLDEKLKNPDRYQTKVVVLGPRRPYDINIIVSLEQFEEQTMTYVYRGVSNSLSRQRAITIKKALNLSLDKKSGFDGDNPF
jgi:hypothetical protein